MSDPSASFAPADLSPAVVLATVSKLQRRKRPAGVVALRGRPRWGGPGTLDAGGESVTVVPCVSALAVREALLGRREGSWLVVVTDRSTEDLGADLCAHFVGQRVAVPELWQSVRDLFQARQLDGALVREPRALAEALLAETPPEGWPPARGGILSRDGAMEALATRALGLAGDRIDPPGLLEWTLDVTALAGLARLSEPAAEALLSWLEERTGPAGRCTLQVVRAGQGPDALPLALIAGLLADPALDAVRAAEARGMLGYRYGGQAPTGETARAWADAARGLVERRLADPPAAERLARAETILASAGGSDLADRSPVLQRGLDARLRTFAEAARAAVVSPSAALLTAAEAAHVEVARHLLADRERQRSGRAHMGLRLLRWLATQDETAATIGAAADRHVRSDGWVDRARAAVWLGDGDPQVAAAYGAVYRAVSERRRQHDERFATLLVEHTERDLAHGGLLHVEDVMAAVVLPLARRGPVLLAVVDGMSVAVATELADGLARDGWREILPEGANHRRPVLAALPSVTEVCRTSLLSGSVRRGAQEDERAGLARLAAGEGLDAALFHKADLERSGAGESLAEPVRAAIGSAMPLVAVVLNTIDDVLDRTDVTSTAWDVDRVRHLPALLHAARYAGRTVVLASDHGHVIERRDGEHRPQDGVSTARWRPGGPGAPPPGPGEVAVSGRRVPGGPVVLPWMETIRYGPIRAGYHGGASQAEVAAPLLVFCTERPESWDVAPPQAPPWWLGAPAVPAEVPVSPADEPQQQSLFGERRDLADAVVGSGVYAAQRERARRLQLDDAKVLAILRALLGADGRLPEDALAALTAIPVHRLRGTMTALQRMLNVEGYEVVGYDPDGVTVVLDLALLREQFELGRR